MSVGRYAVAVLAVGVAILVRLPLQPLLGAAVPYLLFFPAIAWTAWYAGFGPGMAATALSAIAALYWFVPPYAVWQWPGIDIVVSVQLFLVVGLIISGLTEALRRTERRVESERATLAATLLGIADGVIVTDPLGRVVMMNGVAEGLTGWNAAEARGRSIEDVFRIVHESSRAGLESPVARVLREGRITGVANSTVLVGRDGREWPIDHSGAPVRGAGDELQGVVLVFRDVTDRRRLEAEQEATLARERQARVEAEGASRVKDEFLATVSHELRTPLNAILGWSRMLAQRTLPPGREEHAVAVIHRNAEAQNRLVEDLLDISRFVTGRMRLAFEPVDMVGIVADAVDAVRVAAEAKQIPIAVQAEASVAPVGGDPGRLRQLVWNLLSNAVKFTPREGRITIRLERASSHVLLQVTDTGVGVAPDLAPRIFDRFTQAESSTAREDGGLGLGLALVRQIAEAHGGSVRVESAGPGLGATFTTALPIYAGSRTSAAEAPRAEPAPAVTSVAPVGPLTHVRVLVVEDDADGRELTQVVLAGCGAEVRVAESSDAALRLLADWRPDVIVSDIGMPGQDGFALRQGLSAHGFDEVPVIALTGYAAAADRERTTQAGFFAHLAKPVDADTLTAAIAEALRRAHDPARG